MRQEHRIHGKTVAVPGLEEQEAAAKKPVLTDFSRGCRRDLCRLDAGAHGGHRPGRHGEKCKKQTRQFMANMFTIERIPGASPATAQREECVDIFIESQFSGGHHLRAYPGNCERPHGHNWKVRVTVRARELDRLGMGIDFRELKSRVASVLAQLDHQDLNELPAFREMNPSSENIALFLYQALEPLLHDGRYALFSVEVRETDNTGVIYYGADQR